MKLLFPFIVVLLFSACRQKPAAIKNTKQDHVKMKQVAQVTAPVDTPVTAPAYDPEMAMATYYIVQVDTGHNFDSLKAISTKAVAILGNRFDMIGRLYKPGKGIIVPEDEEKYGVDAGQYYPRRPWEDESFVSIEMEHHFCNKEADEMEMVSIAGMYSEKVQADSVTALLKAKIPTVKTIQHEVYMGCMH